MITTNNPIGNKIGDFKILEQIGSGGFATVYRAVCLQPGYEDDYVAIKMINKKEVKKKRLKKRVVSEIDIHSTLSHPAIVQFFTWFEDENYFYLVLEICEGGSLEEYTRVNGPMAEKDACGVIKQVIDGMKYLHTMFILHRDLSMKNILLTKNKQIKIADFGMAAKLKHPGEKKCTMLGTANFISPEVVRKEFYDFKADCWSVGCVLYALLYGSPPFDGKEKKYMEIMNDAVMSPLKFPSSASSEAKALLEGLLNKNPNDRINILDPLQYPFFQKYEKTCDKFSEYPRSGDSGLSSLSSSHSAYKSQKSKQTLLLNSFRGDLKEVHTRYGYSVPNDLQMLQISKFSGCHSGSCTNLLQHKYSKRIYDHQEERPHSQSPSTDNAFLSINQLRNKMQVLPSRQRMEESFAMKPVCSSQESDKVMWEQPNQHLQYFHCHSNHRENRLESQIEDLPSQNHLNSPLPYPSHLLHNLVEDHLYSNSYYSGHNTLVNGHSNEMSCKKLPDFLPQTNKCSHEYYCAPENHCSHELVCGCRHYHEPANLSKNSCHSSHYKDKSKDCVELVLEKNPRTEEKKLKDVVSPLSTLRLPPKRYTTKNAIVSILNDGQVCLEFFKVKKNRKFVNHVCFISRDGWTILLYKPKKNLVPTNEPPALPNNLKEVQYFNFETLPESHWKKYQYAKRFIDIVRAKTPKVTIYNKDCKCVMMENSPDSDYEVNFINGGVITHIRGNTVFTDQNGCTLNFNSQSDLTTDAKIVLDIFNNMKEKCKAIESSLEKLSENSDNNDTYFPVIIGRRSNCPAVYQDSSKENTTPHSHHSSALNGAINTMKSYDGTMNTDYSPYNNSLQSSMSRSKMQNITAPIKSIVEILQDLKDLPKIQNDKVVAEYKDGVQMWSSKDGQDVYLYDTRTKQKLTTMQNRDIMKRVQQDLTGILFYVLSSEAGRRR